MEFIKLFLTSLVTCLVLDAIWLGVIAKSLYQENIGILMRKANGAFAIIWPSALLVYVLMVLGIVLFVIPKAEESAWAALFWGALFGGIVYGVYDFTNYAILAGWSLKISLIDLAWGMILCGLVSFVTVALVK